MRTGLLSLIIALPANIIIATILTPPAISWLGYPADVADKTTISIRSSFLLTKLAWCPDLIDMNAGWLLLTTAAPTVCKVTAFMAPHVFSTPNRGFTTLTVDSTTSLLKLRCPYNPQLVYTLSSHHSIEISCLFYIAGTHCLHLDEQNFSSLINRMNHVSWWMSRYKAVDPIIKSAPICFRTSKEKNSICGWFESKLCVYKNWVKIFQGLWVRLVPYICHCKDHTEIHSI